MAVMEAVSSPAKNGRRASAVRETVLRVEGLTVAYNGEPAIEDVTFSVAAGEKVAVIGSNGAGKSTLMQAILGLLQKQTGTITLAGIQQEQLGYVPQHEGVSWDFPVTVRDVVMMGRTRHIGWLRWAGRAQWQAVDAALERVRMLDLRDRQIGELSGGQRRRVFIARALAQEAKMLLLDEPFSGVDIQAQTELLEVLDGLNRDGMTILLSTHDLDLAFRCFDKVLALRRKVLAYGTPDAVSTPDVLAQMYGGRLAFSEDGKPVSVYVDTHVCGDC